MGLVSAVTPQQVASAYAVAATEVGVLRDTLPSQVQEEKNITCPCARLACKGQLCALG